MRTAAPFVGPRWRRFGLLLLVVLITLHGGLLRLEVLHARYGWMARPAWVHSMESHALPIAGFLRPAGLAWAPEPDGYLGGDPINYLRFAREMRSFYQAHVREPVFLALTRGFLELMQDRDVALSYASATASTLAIPAVFLLGSLFARSVGIAAAAALAIEYDAISWAPDGWRDDTFMLFVTLAAWALVRLRREPTAQNIALAGITGGLVCLTRLSALSFIVPAFIYVAVKNEFPLAAAARRVAAAGVLAFAIVLPFLVNCARATGDPFFAVNYHTRYYRAAEHLPEDHSVNALEYVLPKFTTRPVQSLDTAFVGLVVFPYANKWHGFAPWWPGLGRILFWCGVAGLLLATAAADGRLLLLIIITSLVPYAMTWSVGGGSEWRFTQHVYPMYIVAALGFVAAAVRAAWAAATRRLDVRTWLHRRRAGAVMTVLLIVAAGCAWYIYAPLMIVRETLSRGEAVNVTAGDRDTAFFSGPWSAPEEHGNVVVRAAQGARVSVRLPVLRRRTAYRITLRADPAETADPAMQPKVTAFFNGRVVAKLHLYREPGRVGTYRFTVAPELADRRLSRLDLVASHTVPAADAGPYFAWLEPTTPVAFRLWYVRIEPM